MSRGDEERRGEERRGEERREKSKGGDMRERNEEISLWN